MSGRDAILRRIREAMATREPTLHPGDFGSWGSAELHRPAGDPAVVSRFASTFTAAGGEVARVDGMDAAAAWMRETAADFASATVGQGVPRVLAPELPRASAAEAALGVSWARAAVAESGTLLLESIDGRRSQLLPPVHVVVCRETEVHGTLGQILGVLRDDLPSAVGLHSGPSKSADIGQVMVRGVHGPGRVIALLVGEAG